MNTANLQLEGLLLALSAIVGLMRKKGIVDDAEFEAALREAEQAALKDEARPEGISAANVEAVLFPIRYLRAAAGAEANAPLQPFSRVATRIGQTKRDIPRAPI